MRYQLVAKTWLQLGSQPGRGAAGLGAGRPVGSRASAVLRFS
jgi:hypothetical protein